MASNGQTNGNSSHRVLKPGMYAPIPTFYTDDEELDVPTFKKHIVMLAKGGVGPVVCGSMGEGHHNTLEERGTLYAAAREALDEAGLKDVLVIAGTGGNSTRQTIECCKIAAKAGADVCLAITPGYFPFAIDREATKQFFIDVAAGSPIPVMLYNFPRASGGIDLDSELVSEIAREAPNTCGIKMTCGAVGKLTRIAAATATSRFDAYPRKSAVAPQWLTYGGFADFLAPSVMGGRAHGAIIGLGNIYPYSTARLFELCSKPNPTPEERLKALELQDLVSDADNSFTKGGISGTKWFLQKHHGYPGRRMRRPLLEMDDTKGAALDKDEAVLALWAVEKELSGAK